MIRAMIAAKIETISEIFDPSLISTAAGLSAIDEEGSFTNLWLNPSSWKWKIFLKMVRFKQRRIIVQLFTREQPITEVKL